MHAALDSSKAERTLEGVREFQGKGRAIYVRPNTVNLLFHPNLLLLETCWGLSLFLFHVCRQLGMLLNLELLLVAIGRAGWSNGACGSSS